MFEYRFLEEVLDTTLSLLAIHYSTAVGAPAHMTPIHYLALVDTKAYWFKKWMVRISNDKFSEIVVVVVGRFYVYSHYVFKF